MQTIRVLLAACLVVTATGCSSISVHHDFDRDADFGSYQTFAWMATPEAAPRSARQAVERNSLLDKRVKSAVEREMGARGFGKADDNPDILVVYHIGVQDKIDVNQYGYSYADYYWGWRPADVSVTHYQEGTLIVDLIDAGSKQLVWRGIAQKTLDPNPSPEKQEQTINNAVAKLFVEYPPRVR